MKKGFRVEQDLAGSMNILQEAYYGIHSLRAAENFSITDRRLPSEMIINLARIKKACALANEHAGVLAPEIAKVICRACDEIIDGKWHDQFIVDPIQGGAGTSTNMNANEVIANRALELLGADKGNYQLIHPNDHVNCAQSTNDVYPTAIRLTLYEVSEPLMDAIERLIDALQEKAEAYRDVVKLGRTQLQDAVPVRAGQMFCAWADVLRREKKRLQCARERMLCIHLGGTAVGTGLAASAAYLQKVVPALTEITGLPLYRSDNCIDATQNADDYVALSAALRGGASSLSKICNDIRLLSSGPSGGLGELLLPVRQNGSSIMPGKVNPVIPEVVNQVAFRIVGFDVTVAMAAEAGQLELNAFEPVIFDSLYQGCTQLCRAILSLERHCIRSMTVNQERCAELVEHSSAMATRLVPQIGYSEACLVACEAQQKRKTVRCVAVEKGLMNEEEAERIFDPLAMTDALETTTCI